MTTLDKIPIGRSVFIKELTITGELRLRLLDMGFIPGTEITVMKKSPLGDPLLLRLRNYDITLRKSEAKKITVTEDKKECFTL